VELHAAHGYLFSQFLSPLTNQRTDRWGGSLERRMQFLLDTVRAIRSVTPESFVLAVKLNSADFQRGGFGEDDAVIVAKALEAEGVQLIEVSGGTYESAATTHGPQRASTKAREAYFLDFAETLTRELTVPLMLSGGFRTRQGMTDALSSGAVDLIGLARPIAHEPDFPRRIVDGSAQASLAKPQTIGNRAIDDLLNSSWHQQQLARLGRGKAVRPDRTPLVALVIGVLTTLRDSIRMGMPR
jgi:2,4-dienoyl-CoA reductase-like NADH-dependent reductase (Old Yellow Enzyme family)